jgi:hypothetical protein
MRFSAAKSGWAKLVEAEIILARMENGIFAYLRDMTRHGAGFGLEIVKITNSIIVNKHLKLSAY